MSKTEYDLKAIMYSAYDKPHKLCNISGNYTIRQPRLLPNNVGRPMGQFKCPLAWFKWRNGSPPVRFVFFSWVGSQREGGIDLDAEIHYTPAAPGYISGTASINHCSCASEVTLNDMGKWKLNGQELLHTQQSKHNTTVCIFYGIYCIRQWHPILRFTVMHILKLLFIFYKSIVKYSFL